MFLEKIVLVHLWICGGSGRICSHWIFQICPPRHCVGFGEVLLG